MTLGDPTSASERKVRSSSRARSTSCSREVQGLRAACRTSSLTTEDFTTDNGMLTPTLKLKRRAVMERYGTDLDGLY